MDPLTFAVVGCGAIATTHINALRSLSEGEAVVVACCDIDAERARAFAETHGLRARTFEEVLSDSGIDCVSFCTPSGIHAEQGAMALLAGKHVMLEKPMDISLAACDALLAAQEKTDRRLAVISQHRFDPASQKVHEALVRGEFGRLILAEARIPWYRTQEYYDSGDWRGTWALDGGGCVMNQGVHTIDLLRWFCGPPTLVFARMHTAGHENIEVEDTLVGTIQFANGVLATVLVSTAAYPGYTASLGLYGTQGSAMIDGDELKVFAVNGGEQFVAKSASLHALQVAMGGTKSATENAGSDSGKFEQDTFAWGDAHREQFADFIRCCRDGRTPLVDGREGRNAVELVLALYESAKTGQVVHLQGGDAGGVTGVV